MKVENNRVVLIHYTLTGDDGVVIDSSIGKEPLAYLHGSGTIIPGLENALAGKETGYKAQVTVNPEEGYGEFDPELVQTLPMEAFSEVEKLDVGMQFQVHSEDGHHQIITVKEIADEGVLVDANHPLSGKILNFDVAIEGVREAAPEELDHGHAH